MAEDPTTSGTSAGEQESLLPAHFRGRVAAAVFNIPLENARQSIGGDTLRPVQLPGRRSLAVLSIFEYFESPLGPYNEVSVGIVVQSKVGFGPFSALDLLSSRPDTGAWMLEMPVTSEKARRYGVELFGYPKTVASIDVQYSSNICLATVHEDHRPLLRVRLRCRRGLKLPVPWLVTYSQKSAEVLRTRIKTEWKVTLAPGAGSQFEITALDHPLSQKLLGLGLSKSPLIVLHGDRFSAILPAGERI